MKKILYVDANVNRESSRTEKLAQVLLERLAGDSVEIETLVLEDECLQPLNGETLNERSAAIQAKDFDNPVFRYAKQFVEADEVVIAAPYWDFSFPAMLKIYFALLTAQGVTFDYSPEGIPTGHCKAQRAYFVTTAGGYFGDWDYGWDQMRSLCQLYYGIPEVTCFRAEGLDIVTNDPDQILSDAIAAIQRASI